MTELDHLTRRGFIRSVALVSGGIAVSAVLPWSVRAAGTTEAALAPLTDWTIDDMWGVYPRYAEPIGFGRPEARAEMAATGSIDALFYA